MTTPRSETDAISRPKHGAPADETQAIPRPAPPTPSAATPSNGARPAPTTPAGAPANGAGPAPRSASRTSPPVPVPPSVVPPTKPTGVSTTKPAAVPTSSARPMQPPPGDVKPDLQKPPVPAAQRPSAGAAPGRPSAPASSSIPTRPPAPARRAPSRGPRRARLQLRHIDPWSALKFSLVVSIALFFVWMVAVGVLYGTLNGLDVFSQVNKLWSELQGSDGEDIVTPTLVFGGAAVIGAINILLFTALSTVGAFIYNLCADLVGGLEITLGERD